MAGNNSRSIWLVYRPNTRQRESHTDQLLDLVLGQAASCRWVWPRAYSVAGGKVDSLVVTYTCNFAISEHSGRVDLVKP